MNIGKFLSPLLKKVRSKRFTFIARIVLSLMMLGAIFIKLPHLSWNDIAPEWSYKTVIWLILAIALTFIGIVLSAMRWQQVLRALGTKTPLSPLISHYFAGQFVANVLPTTIGGDVLRVHRLSKQNGDTVKTFTSVALERLTGWLVLPLLTLFGFAINPGLRSLGRPTKIAFVIACLTLVGLFIILFFADHPRLGGRFVNRQGWTRFLSAIHLGVHKIRNQPQVALQVVGAGIIYQLTLIGAAVSAAQFLGLRAAGFTALLAFLPPVMIAQVLPLGISGLGIRESAFIIFLGPLGVTSAQAVTFGLLLYVLNLLASLTGAPAFLFGKKKIIAT